MNLILDNLMAGGKLKPLIVVMPYGYAYPPTHPLASGADAMKRPRSGFERDLIDDVIALVQANYRVYTDRDHRGVKHVWRETDGAHTWLNWRRYLAEVAPMLFDTAR